MKRVSKIITFLFVVLLLSGCMKYNTHMGISAQGDVELSVIIALANSIVEDESLAAEMGGSMSISAEDMVEYEQLGFKVEDYKDSTWTGAKLTKTYKISEVSTTSPITVSLDSLMEGESQPLFQSLGNDTYKGHFTVDGTSDETDGMVDMDEMSAADLEALYASMDLTYTVTLPSAPISSNADQVSGNTLTWKLKTDGVTDIQYEFSLKQSSTSASNVAPNSSSNANTVANDKKDSTTMWIIIGVAVAAVVLVIIVVAVMMSKKKKNTNVMPMNGVQPMPQMPMQQPVQPMQQVPQMPQNMVSQPVQQPMAQGTPVAPQAPVTQPTDGNQTPNGQ